MRTVILKDSSDLEGCRTAWEALCEEVREEGSVFGTWQWYATWWRHYSAGATLNIVTAWEGEDLVGIAPLMLRRVTMHGLPATALCFIANNQSLNNDFIVRPSHRTPFVRSLFDALSGQSPSWDVMILKNLPEGSRNFAALAEFAAGTRRKWRRRRTCYDAPFLVPSGTWDEYLATRTTRTRKSLRNIENGFRRAGEVSVRNIRSWDEFLAVKDEVHAVAKRSWAEEGGDSLASNGNQRFFDDLARKFSEKGWLSLWTLSLDGRIIAVEFHVRGYGKEHAMRGHYLPEFASLSPGTFLELQILKSVFQEQERVGVYDFCGSFETYKRKWTETCIPHQDIEIFGDTIRGRLLAFHETVTVPLLKRAFPPAFWNNRLFRACGINTGRIVDVAEPATQQPAHDEGSSRR